MTEKEALELKRRYPWYKPARIVLDHGIGGEDPVLALHYMLFPRTGTVEVGEDDFRKYENSLVIDDFLACGNVHILAGEEVTDEDLSAAAGQDDELVSEELAEIYLTQGYRDMARKAYRKLSLLYPEKSVYFAELIERIDRDEPAAKAGKSGKR